jgi:hypothetical protein
VRIRAAVIGLLVAAAPAHGRTVHVRADLAAAVHEAPRGARIVVHPGTYKGSVRLKPRQQLIGRGSPKLTTGKGDAVRLARGTTVRGLVIDGAARGGIYGNNVSNVRIVGNDVSHHNTGCAAGFLIPPFSVPTTAPGVGVPISDGLQNGWAGIMVDADKGSRRVVIRGNRVHDADCGDGIDVRASKTARMRVTIAGNDVAELREGDNLESILAIGLQTRDTARMTATIDRNRQSGLGNDEDTGAGPSGADSEGVFLNPADRSRLRATVSRNTYAHTAGRGGFSANGLEFVSMGEGASGDVTVRDSAFSGPPGDVIEQLALGTGADLRLTLERVTAKDSTGFSGSGFGNTVVIPGNNGDCVIGASGGARNRVGLTVRDSTLTGCANNGITFGSSVSNGSGPTAALRLDVRGSVITGNQGNNLRIGNVSELDDLSVRVQDTDLSDADGTGSLTPANVSFEDIGSTANAVINISGGNCLDGGPLSAALVGYDVTARGNWWGGPVRATAVAGTLDSDPVLSEPPARCTA